MRRVSRTAIDRRRSTAADQQLFTLETVQPGRLGDGGSENLFYCGTVRCQTAQENILRGWLPEVEWIGRGRSRGLGQIKLTVEDDLLEDAPSLLDRLSAFDEAVRRDWSFYRRVARATPPSDETRFFSLDLLAPAIFTRNGLPALEPDLADLGLDPGSASIYRAFTDRQEIGGWHMGAGLPRRIALAAAMGSVYMIKVEGLSLKTLTDRLEPVEIGGLGEERERGFGRVLISSPFHYEPEVTL